jgi:flagellar hook protein FlgE
MSAFSIPLSGLMATSQSLNSIANNLANLNTDGYKNQTLDFASVFNQMQGTSGNGDPIQVGDGVQVAGAVANFTNGNVDSTGVSSNMALQGNGFFVVQNGSGADYTRDGDFTVNSQGQLCTEGGQLVLGYPAVNGVVQSGAALAPITVNQANNIPAVATTSFQMTTNLDATATVGTTYSAPMTVYDSLGNRTISPSITPTLLPIPGATALRCLRPIPAAPATRQRSPAAHWTSTLRACSLLRPAPSLVSQSQDLPMMRPR